VAFIARIKDGKSALWIRPLALLDAHPIADADSLAFPFWSPDSQSLAFFNDGQLKRVAISGGPPQAICEAPAGRGGTWSSSGVIVFASSTETSLSQVAASGGAPKPATVLGTSPDERSHRFPQFLTDGRRFSYTVYLNDPNRNPLLKVASLDATSTTVVTETSFAQSFIFNGYVLFRRDRSGPFLAQRFDETTLALASEPVAVIDRPASGPVGGAIGISGSRTGALAYQTTLSDPTAQLTWFGRSGRTLGHVGRPSSFGFFDVEYFSLSPDGTQVAALQTDTQTHRNDTWIVDALRGVRSRATVDGTVEDPKWSPDGRRIAFTSGRLGTGHQNIYVKPSTGQGPEEPLLTSVANKFLWDWSPDGARLLFGAEEGPKAVHNLWTLPFDGGRVPQRYLSSEFSKVEARFSPNARWVAYQSNESGLDQVYVQSYPDPATRYQVSSAGGTRPRWRHDGQELFFISPDGTLMSTTIRSNGRLEIGTPAKLFHTSSTNGTQTVNFEVAPDGQRFLIAEVVSQPSRSPITILLNWNPFPKK
jgi:Tol biopolymer transport system component